MKVLIDSSVWSLVLRRSAAPGGDHAAHVNAFHDLVRENLAVMIGPIRQEVLSGVRDATAFHRLREKLRAWPDLPLESADYERAAECFNTCRAKGIQGAHADFLICAVAERHNLSILTTDRDFTHYARLLPIRLHIAPRRRQSET